MENDDPAAQKNYPVAAAKLSKTPSWIMLGFLLGAAFVVALPPLRKTPPAVPAPAAVADAEPPPPRVPPQLTTIEAVFAAEEQYALWTDDLTEVALWSSRDNTFSDFYEVRRIGPARYFRTISTLTRRIIQHGKPRPESPLQFTQSEEQYREWLEHGRIERRTEEFRPQARSGPRRDWFTIPAVKPTVPPPPEAPVLDGPLQKK